MSLSEANAEGIEQKYAFCLRVLRTIAGGLSPEGHALNAFDLMSEAGMALAQLGEDEDNQGETE